MGGCRRTFPTPFGSPSLHSTAVVAAHEAGALRCPHFDSTLDSNICSRKNRPMAALLDLHPERTHPVLSGVAEVHAMLDRMHAGAVVDLAGEHARVVAELDRATRRIESLKLKVVAAADQAGTAKDAGFTNTGAWVAKTTTVSRSDAARQVALAAELDSGHDATATALDAGLVSPGHAAVIVQRHRTTTRHGERRAAPGGRSTPGGEGRSVQPRPAPPARPPGDRGRRTRPDASWTPTRTSWSAPRNKPPRTSAR